MNQITNLSDDPDQITNAILWDGTIATLEFIYGPNTQRWYMNVTHPLLTLNLVNLCTGPNILRDFRNKMNWGLACASKDGCDPFSIEDFISGRISIYTLSAADVALVESQIFQLQGAA